MDADDRGCADSPPRLFFPPRGTSADEAKAICRQCPYMRPCLEYAIVNVERFGIWGGKSERERRRMRRQQRAEGSPIGRNQYTSPARCGTATGYRKHIVARTTPCDACREAEAERQRRYREKKKAAA